MWLLKTSDSTANLLNRTDSFKMKVKRGMKQKRPRDSSTVGTRNYQRHVPSMIPGTNSLSSNDSPSNNSSSASLLHYNRLSPLSQRSNSGTVGHASPLASSPSQLRASSSLNIHQSLVNSRHNLSSSTTALSSPPISASQSNSTHMLGLANLDRAGHSTLHSQSLITVVNGDYNPFRISEDIANLIESINTPIITISFLQSPRSKSNAQVLIASLCQNRLLGEYSIQGVHVSLFEYTIHQTTITLLLLCVEEFTMRKEVMRREESLFFMTLLLSSIVVFDSAHASSDVITEADLRIFSHLTEMKHRLKATGHFIKPKLLWLYQEKASTTDNSSQPDLNVLNDRFEHALSHVENTKDAKLKFAIKKCFPTRSCFVIPSTSSSHENIHEAGSQFTEGVSALRHHLANPNNIKKISTNMENVKINGRTFVNYLTQLVGCLNRNEAFLAPKVAKEIISSDSNVLYQRIANKYAFKLEQQRQKLPLDHIELEEWNRRRTQDAVQELQLSAQDDDHSDRILRQLISQLEGTLLTDFYKLLRDNEQLCRAKSEEVLQRLYQKIQKRLDAYKTVEQFNMDVADMKTSFWHQSVGPEKQNIWIQFNGNVIQQDLLILRRRMEDGRRGGSGATGAIGSTSLLVQGRWVHDGDDSQSSSPTKSRLSRSFNMMDSPENVHGSSSSLRHKSPSFLPSDHMSAANGNSGSSLSPGHFLPERFSPRIARLRNGSVSPNASQAKSLPAYASPTASSSRHIRTKFPRLNS